MYYILLDVVQLADEFEDVLNGFLHIANTDTYVTGSNARFLSKDSTFCSSLERDVKNYYFLLYEVRLIMKNKIFYARAYKCCKFITIFISTCIKYYY